jgi:hypothetical protein
VNDFKAWIEREIEVCKGLIVTFKSSNSDWKDYIEYVLRLATLEEVLQELVLYSERPVEDLNKREIQDRKIDAEEDKANE